MLRIGAVNLRSLQPRPHSNLPKPAQGQALQEFFHASLEGWSQDSHCCFGSFSVHRNRNRRQECRFSLPHLERISFHPCRFVASTRSTSSKLTAVPFFRHSNDFIGDHLNMAGGYRRRLKALADPHTRPTWVATRAGIGDRAQGSEDQAYRREPATEPGCNPTPAIRD